MTLCHRIPSPNQRKGGFTALSNSRDIAYQTITIPRGCSKRNTKVRSLSVVGDRQESIQQLIDWNTRSELRSGDLSLSFHAIREKGTTLLSDHTPSEVLGQIRDGSIFAIERLLGPFDVFQGHPLLNALFWGFIVVNLYVFVVLTPRQ